MDRVASRTAVMSTALHVPFILWTVWKGYQMATEQQATSLNTREQDFRQRKSNTMYIGRDVIMSEAIKKLSGTALRVYLIFLNKKVMVKAEGKAEKRKGEYSAIDCMPRQALLIYLTGDHPDYS